MENSGRALNNRQLKYPIQEKTEIVIFYFLNNVKTDIPCFYPKGFHRLSYPTKSKWTWKRPGDGIRDQIDESR